MRAAQHFIEPHGVNFGAEEVRLGEDAAEKRGVGFDAGDGIFLEGAAKARNGFFATVAPGDEFAEKRIVVHRDGPAFVDAFVDANAGAAGRMTGKNFSG